MLQWRKNQEQTFFFHWAKQKKTSWLENKCYRVLWLWNRVIHANLKKEVISGSKKTINIPIKQELNPCKSNSETLFADFIIKLKTLNTGLP